MSGQVITKRCSVCKQIKTISEFYPRKDRRSGYRPQCKECGNAYGRSPKGRMEKQRYDISQKGREAARRHRKSESNKNAQKRYRQSKKGILFQIQQRQRNRIQINARACVNQAVKRGTIPRPETLPCVRLCGNQAEEYHHHKGYEKPHHRDVVPICILCHKSIPNK